MCNRLTLVAVATLFLTVVSGTASAFIDVTVHSGESLVLKFHQPGVPPSETNVLHFGYGIPFEPGLFLYETSYSLYDGTNLLGSTNIPSAIFGANFATPDVSGFLPFSAVVDFTSILAGTLDGRLIVTPDFYSTSGSIRYVAPDIETYKLFHLLETVQFPIIDAAFAAPTESVPEPATAGLVAIASAVIVAARCVRRGSSPLEG